MSNAIDGNTHNKGDHHASRKICIIGAGLSGLGYLQAFLHLPEEARRGWEIDCFEGRDTAGGIWHPQPKPPSPPTVPETPAYLDLETITIGTGMTFPNRPLPPSTLLFPRVETFDNYIQDHIRDFNLAPHIHLRHTVKDASLDPQATVKTPYPWTVTIERVTSDGQKETLVKEYSTVVVGNGITPTPRFLDAPGEKEWLEAGTRREITHSMWYRSPEIAKGRIVVVLGNHPSGNHIALALNNVADELHHVFVPDMLTATMATIEGPHYHHHSSRVVSFTPEGVVLADGSTLVTPPDALVIEATGYWHDHPFLPPSVLKRVHDGAFHWDSPTLESNDRYVRPLHKCLLPIDPEIPYGSLAFACLFPIIWNFPTSYAQGLWFAHLLANLDANDGTSKLLPQRETALAEIQALEKAQASFGFDMAKKSYVLLPPGKATDDISDQLVREVRQHSQYSLPDHLLIDPNREFTEPWRRRAFAITLGLIQAWQAAKGQGIEASFSKGTKTEEEFAEAAEKLQAWWDERKPQRNGNGNGHASGDH